MAPDADVVLFGHTHTFAQEFNNGTLFLNPGEVCARSKPISECAMLEVTEDKFFVTHYARDKKNNEVPLGYKFDSKEFSYKRTK
jgi:predicted phosphodiesterase